MSGDGLRQADLHWCNGTVCAVLKPRRYYPSPELGAPRRDDGIVDNVAVMRRINGEEPQPDLSGRELVCFFHEAYTRGMTDREIAEVLGAAEASVGDWRREHKLPVNRRYTDDQLTRMLTANAKYRGQASAHKLEAAGVVAA